MARYKMPRWIPNDSKAYGVPDVAVVYKYEKAGKPCAIGYLGKASKSSYHERYRTPERRDEVAVSFVRSACERKEEQAQRRTQRATYVHDMDPGTILHYSWGYDQTNCDYFQVVARTDHTVTLRAIGAVPIQGSEGFMSQRLRPHKDAFLADSEPFTKRVQPCTWRGPDVSGYVSMDFGIATPCGETETHYSSWYA